MSGSTTMCVYILSFYDKNVCGKLRGIQSQNNVIYEKSEICFGMICGREIKKSYC